MSSLMFLVYFGSYNIADNKSSQRLVAETISILCVTTMCCFRLGSLVSSLSVDGLVPVFVVVSGMSALLVLAGLSHISGTHLG